MAVAGRSVFREIGAGIMASVIALPICVSTGVLGYEPLGPGFLGQGAAFGITCAVAGGLAGALLRTSSFIPNVTSGPMALVQASFASALLTEFGGNADAALAILPLSIILAGVFQGLIGAAGVARIVKFTPYPVLAGFVTGLCVLTFLNQLPHLFGLDSLAALGRLAAAGGMPNPVLPAFGGALVALMLTLARFVPRWPHLVIGLVGGSLLFHAAQVLAPGLDLGPTIGPFSVMGAGLGLHTDLEMVRIVSGSPDLAKSLLFTALTIAVLGTLDISFAQRSAQRLADIDVAPRRNVLAQGAANVCAALVGGLAVSSSFTFALTIFQSGGRTRLATVAMALTLLGGALFAAPIVSGFPIVVLAAILITIAFQQWDRWCMVLAREIWASDDPTSKARARRNALIVMAVMAATVLGQPIMGAAVGVGLSCLVFIAEMSRPIVRREVDGLKTRSKRIRSQHDRAILHDHGVRTRVLELEGVLFFGNADDLAARVRSFEGCADRLILDLHRVSDLDVSGASVLHQLAERCRERGIALLVSGADPKIVDLVQDALGPAAERQMVPDLDGALERVEDDTIAAAGQDRTAMAALRLDQTDLASGLSERDLDTLRARLTPCSYPAGAALCHAGEEADRLWLLTRGSVSVRVAGTRSERRIAALGPGTSVGEMGLLDRRPRSADVVADEDVEGFVLTIESFDALLRSEPLLGQSLLATIARQTAQRLRTTSEELRLAEV